jgi:hypothetical protein
MHESGFWFLGGSKIQILSCIVVGCVYLCYVDNWQCLVILYSLVVGVELFHKHNGMNLLT